MSQQRILTALCLFAAVALVSGQSFNWESCSRSVRQEADRFRESMMGAGQKFTSSLQSTGTQAVDTSAFQQDLDKLTSSVSSLTDMSQGFDMSKFTNMYLENMQTMASLMRTSLGLYMRIPSATLTNYVELGNTAYTAQTQFMQKVTNSCMPSARSQ